MRIARTGFMLLVWCGITVSAGVDDYAALLGRLKANDFTVDFRALRLAYTRTPDYHPNSSASHEFKKQIQAALESKDYAGCF